MTTLTGTPTQKNSFVENLFNGLKDYGFIILTDHLVNQTTVDKAYDLFMKFYKLPLDKKLEYGKEKYKKQRGYIPFGLEKAVGNDIPDLKEFFHVGRSVAKGHRFEEFYPENVWPSELENFKEIALELYQSMDETSKYLLCHC